MYFDISTVSLSPGLCIWLIISQYYDEGLVEIWAELQNLAGPRQQNCLNTL